MGRDGMGRGWGGRDGGGGGARGGRVGGVRGGGGEVGWVGVGVWEGEEGNMRGGACIQMDQHGVLTCACGR